MRDKLASIKERYDAILEKLSNSQDQQTALKLNKERAQLEPIVDAYLKLKKCSEELLDNQELLKDSDPEMRALAKTEVDRLKTEEQELEARIKVLLLPKDPLDEKNIIL